MGIGATVQVLYLLMMIFMNYNSVMCNLQTTRVGCCPAPPGKATNTTIIRRKRGRKGLTTTKGKNNVKIKKETHPSHIVWPS